MGGGVKFDQKKVRYDLIPADCLHELAKVYTHGAQKYEDNNWRKGMSWNKILGSLDRHFNSFKRGQNIDPDSGLLHLAQVAWNAFTLMNYLKTHPELDDRVKDLPEGVDISKYELEAPRESVANMILNDKDPNVGEEILELEDFVIGKQKLIQRNEA